MSNRIFAFLVCMMLGYNLIGQEKPFVETFDNGTVAGVKGRAKYFDGYFTENMIPASTVTSSGNFTIEAWIAVQEYAFTVAAIVDQENDFRSGYLFGINQRGQLSGSVSVNGEWVTCVSSQPVPLLKWSHVSMVVENAKAITLYLNGENAGSIPLTGNITLCDTCLLSIGKTQTKTSAANIERETSMFTKTNNRFDGLMDEFYIYPKSLSSTDILSRYKAITPSNTQPLQYRQMPSGPARNSKFGAVYTQLKYSTGWDALWRGSEYPDIVVRFDNCPVRFVFWRGTGYIPAIVNEKNMWMTDQSLEHWGTGECYEAMGDKQARYTHVRIIENSPARVVIHWRYALAGINHQLFPPDENGWSDWADEYWTIYPDGIAARKQVLWSKRYEADKGSMQWQETIFFCQPGTRPQDNVDMQALTLMDMQGNKASYSWDDGPPNLKMFTNPVYQPIEYINFKSVYKPFSIFDEKRVCQPFSFGNTKDYTTFPNWNHWPVQQVASDGTNAVAFDKPSHSSLTGSNGNMQIVEKKGDGVYWASSLKGMTDKPIDSLMTLAKSWNLAPTITLRTKGISVSYDKYQRAYILKTNALQKSISFTVHATMASPVFNIPLVLENYAANIQTVQMNNKLLKAGKDYTVGQADGLENTNTIIFIKEKTNTPVTIQIN